MNREIIDSVHHLQDRFSKIEPSLQMSERMQELRGLQEQIQASDFWNDQQKAQKITKKIAYLEKFLDRWEGLKTDIQNLKELVEQSQEDELALFGEEIQELHKKFEQGEVDVLLSEEFDKGNAILSLHVGNGGQDAEDFCQMLYRMYGRYAEDQDWKINILDESRSDVGLKSATLEIQGMMAYGRLKSEHGVHRLIRLSPFNAKSLRQTSFARVEVLPEIEDDDELEIKESDLRIDVFRSSGAGGQSVNTTDSAVRITYIPLNIIVTCQNEKSQLQNKESAMKVLRSRLMKLKLEQKAQKLEELRGDMMENSFGSQIRTYTLQPYKLVKDHRTDVEHPNPDKVFDGDLDIFIEGFLRKK
jgi:peptide chain release factor 2